MFSGAAKMSWKFLPRTFYFNKSLRRLNLALTRVCNIDCVFCPYQVTRNDEKKHMPDEIFEKVLKDMADARITTVMLSPDLGEPLLAPDFIHKVKRLRKAGATSIEVTTNGTYFHKIGIDQMLGDGPEVINISFPGFDENMYNRVCRRPFYVQTRDNILSLIERNQALGSPKKIRLFLRGDMGLEQMLAWQEIHKIRNSLTSLSAMTEVDDWLGLIKESMLTAGFSLQRQRPGLTRRPCLVMFDIAVHPDGDMHLCSCRNIVREPLMHIGNVRDMSLEEGYQKIPHILDLWAQGKIPGICHKCSMYCDPANAVSGRILQTFFSGIKENHKR